MECFKVEYNTMMLSQSFLANIIPIDALTTYSSSTPIHADIYLHYYILTKKKTSFINVSPYTLG